MTTYDNDIIAFVMSGKQYAVRLIDLGLEWPPPMDVTIPVHKKIAIVRSLADELDGAPPEGYLWVNEELKMRQMSCSTITDDERSKMTNVCRGALYESFGDFAVVISTHADRG